MAEKSIIIIGGGLAGMAAGCYAQMNSYKTQIFELHNIPGGLCTSWKRKDYLIDGCIHWLIGSRSGGFHRFYEELGAVQGREMIDSEEFIRVEGKGGKTLIVYSDVGRLEKHMLELSPEDSGTIKELCDAVRLLSHHDAPIEKPRELMGLFDMLKMLRLMRWAGTVNKYNKITVQDFASRFNDSFLRKGFPLVFEDLPGITLSALLVTMAELHKKNAGVPVGGSREFARAIERRYLDMGGEIHYKSRVEKILVEKDRAVGVRLKDGSEHRADMVISAADGRTTIFDMLEGKYVDDKIRGYYKEWPYHKGYLQLSFGVARDFSNEPHRIAMQFEKPVDVAGQTRNWATFMHYCSDSTMAPEGKSVVTVSFLFVSFEHWKKLREDRKSYKAEKKALADAVIVELEKRFPGIKDQIEVVDVATPVTYERYTGNWKGSYMGWMDTPMTAGKSMERTLPGLENFYMAGQWVYMGGGVAGSIMSGRHLIQIICKKDKKTFTTSVP